MMAGLSDDRGLSMQDYERLSRMEDNPGSWVMNSLWWTNIEDGGLSRVADCLGWRITESG